jgi:hypothetical protein
MSAVDPVYHIIYASRANFRLSQRDLLELLKVCRGNNEVFGLTGMLLYRDGTYMQFLEGRSGDIDALLSRLRKDNRHRDIRTLREGTLPHRLFPDWSMAYKNLAGVKGADVPGYSEILHGESPGRHATNGIASPLDPEHLLVRMFLEMLVMA